MLFSGFTVSLWEMTYIDTPIPFNWYVETAISSRQLGFVPVNTGEDEFSYLYVEHAAEDKYAGVLCFIHENGCLLTRRQALTLINESLSYPKYLSASCMAKMKCDEVVGSKIHTIARRKGPSGEWDYIERTGYMARPIDGHAAEAMFADLRSFSPIYKWQDSEILGSGLNAQS